MPAALPHSRLREKLVGSQALGRVTIRSIVLAIVLAVVNDYWLVQLEVVRYSHPSYAAPFYNAVFTLLVLTVANFALRSRFPRRALSSIELLTVYVMVSITTGVCSHNMMSILVSSMGYAHFFQTPENQWGKLFIERLPHWLIVSDTTSLRNFYYGNSTLYTWANVKPWILPGLMWSSFTAVMLFTTLCINSILRKQWIEAERLTFPIIMLPLEMTEESGALFKNKYMWMGFAFAGGLTLFAGLNYLYPSIPCLRIQRQNIGYFIVNPPWNAIGSVQMGFYFFAIGLAFLMPLELSFSCWFFFWLARLELVFCRMVGLNELAVVGSGFDRAYPFLNSQAYGAYFGFFVMSMWASRRYLGRVFRTAFRGTKEEDESREAVSYRTAILGALAGVLLLCVLAYNIGMTLWVVAVFFVLYFILVIIICRIRAELGFPTHDMYPMSPHFLLVTAPGPQHLAAQDLVGFSLFTWFNKSYASHPAPHQMEGFKICERRNASARGMFIAAMIAGIVAVPLGFWMLLHMYYHNGAATANVEQWALGHGRDAWSTLAVWLKQPAPPNGTAMEFVGVGFLVVVLLSWLRIRFLAFPFHPLAYALAPSWGVAQLWMPLLIGSTAKFLSLRFGGLQNYRRVLPFFYGLMLGEIVIGSLWTIIGIALGIPTYDFWPGKYQ